MRYPAIIVSMSMLDEIRGIVGEELYVAVRDLVRVRGIPIEVEYEEEGLACGEDGEGDGGVQARGASERIWREGEEQEASDSDRAFVQEEEVSEHTRMDEVHS